MELEKIIGVGILLFFTDLCWVLWDNGYGAVKVYNLKEKEKYRYLGRLWISRKQGQFYLKIPRKMVEISVTTEYKIKAVSLFHKAKKDGRLKVIFAGGYETEIALRKEMRVKNYIATSGQL